MREATNNSTYNFTLGINNINGFVLKLIAVITMVIDHVGSTLPILVSSGIRQSSSWYYVYIVFRYIGRFSFPLFAFLLVEGVLHTHNKRNYALRMFLFAIISEVPYDLLFHHTFIEFTNQNIMFTLCLGIIFLSTLLYIRSDEEKSISIDMVKLIYLTLIAFYYGYYIEKVLSKLISLTLNKVLLYILLTLSVEVLLILIYSKQANENDKFILCADTIILAFFMCVADLAQIDYASRAMLVLYIFFLFRGQALTGMAGATFILGILSSSMELINVLMLPVINSYNGERGKKTGLLFYAFYPAHLLIIVAILILLGKFKLY